MSLFGGNSGQADWNQIEKLIKMMTDVNRFNQQGLFTDTTWDKDKGTQSTGLAPGMEQAFTQLMQRASAPPRTYESPSQFSALLDAKMANQMQRHNILDPEFELPQGMFGDTSADQRKAREEAYRKALEESYSYEPRGPGSASGSEDPFTTDAGDREGFDPTDDNPDRYGPDGNLNTRDMERTNQISDFVDWGIRNHAFDSGRDINDILNDYIPQAPEGTDPSALEQWAVEKGPWLGRAIGSLATMASGIPGLSNIGRWVASKITDNYWNDHQWQSPADTDAMMQYLADQGMDMQDDNRSAQEIIDAYMNYGYTPQQSEPRNETYRGPDGNFTNPTDSQFVNDWNNRYGNTYNSNFDAAGNRIGRSGSMFGDMPEGVRFEGGRPVGADGRAPDAGDLWVTFDYGN